MKPHFPCPCFDDAMTAAKYMYKQHQCNGMGDQDFNNEESHENHTLNATHPNMATSSMSHSSNGTAAVGVAQQHSSQQQQSSYVVAPLAHSSGQQSSGGPVVHSTNVQQQQSSSPQANNHMSSQSSMPLGHSSGQSSSAQMQSSFPEPTPDQKKKFMQCMLGDKKPTNAANCQSPKQSCFNRDFCPGMPDKSHPMSDADKQKFRAMAKQFHDDMMSCVKG